MLCRIIDSSNQNEVARYTLSSQDLIRHKLWPNCIVITANGKMHAIGENGTGRTIADLLPKIVVHL